MNEKRQQLIITITNQIQIKKKRIKNNKMPVGFYFWPFIHSVRLLLLFIL
jgi:hypothetical protein